MTRGTRGQRCRLVVATHPAGPTQHRSGVPRGERVSERFVTTRPQEAVTAAAVVALSLRRGACEPTRSDEDSAHDRDRWCSPAACGQEAWQIVSPWLWNRRRELGHHREPEPMRPTACAPFHPPARQQPRWPCLSHTAASLDATVPFRLMAPCVALPGRRSARGKSAERRRGACGWGLRLASATVEAVRDAKRVRGRVAPPRSHARSVCGSIRSRSAQLPCSGTTGVADRSGERACTGCVANGWTCTWGLPLHLAPPPLHPCFLVPTVPMLDAHGKSDRLGLTGWSEHDPAVPTTCAMSEHCVADTPHMCLFEWDQRIHPLKEADRSRIADGSIPIQTSSEAQPATPCWRGEVALGASHRRKHGSLDNRCQGF